MGIGRRAIAAGVPAADGSWGSGFRFIRNRVTQSSPLDNGRPALTAVMFFKLCSHRLETSRCQRQQKQIDVAEVKVKAAEYLQKWMRP